MEGGGGGGGRFHCGLRKEKEMSSFRWEKGGREKTKSSLFVSHIICRNRQKGRRGGREEKAIGPDFLMYISFFGRE